MTATDELRRLLDERGARWTACSKATIDNQTFCHGHTFTEFQGGLMVTDLTPEQAVEATLGRGTCHDAAGKQMAFFSCSACGATIERKHPRFCFACGRKVVDE